MSSRRVIAAATTLARRRILPGTASFTADYFSSSLATRPWEQKSWVSHCRPASSAIPPERENEEEAEQGPSPFAAVSHGDAYEEAVAGRHGQQLALAYLEGEGKDDPPYDPFAEFEEEEEEEDYGDEDEYEGGDLDEGSKDDADVDDIEDDYVSSSADDTDAEATEPGRTYRKRSELAALRAGLPAGGLFAIIRLAGTQYKVCKDDVIIANKLRPTSKYSPGSIHTLTSQDILLMGSSHKTLVGLPGVGGGEVDMMVEEITRDATVIVFKKRRRKNSRRKKGFRREVTFLRVLDIRMPHKMELRDHEHR